MPTHRHQHIRQQDLLPTINNHRQVMLLRAINSRRPISSLKAMLHPITRHRVMPSLDRPNM